MPVEFVAVLRRLVRRLIDAVDPRQWPPRVRLLPKTGTWQYAWATRAREPFLVCGTTPAAAAPFRPGGALFLRDERPRASSKLFSTVPRAANANHHVRFLQAPDGPPTPVYTLASGVLSLAPDLGAGRYPVCLITQPKAGTYLVARLLEALGMVNTGIHVDRRGFTDYRDKTIDEMRRDYLTLDTPIPIKVSARLIAPGQFVVGHLEHAKDSLAATRRLRRILLVRDVRDALASSMRFFTLPGRGVTKPRTWMAQADGPDRMNAFLDQWGASLIGMTRGILGWMNDPDILLVRFEDLMGDNGPAVQRQVLKGIAHHVGCDPSRDVVSLFLRDVVGKPTKTYSGSRSVSWAYWDMRVERTFTLLGGGELQYALGYSVVWPELANAAD